VIFRRTKTQSAQVEDILDKMGRVFYDFDLVAKSYNVFSGSYQLPITPDDRGALVVGGWLKIPIRTELLPTGVFLSHLQDVRLLTALKSVLERNVEVYVAPLSPISSIFSESPQKNFDVASNYELWYFVELDELKLHSISRRFNYSDLPHPSALHYTTIPIPFGPTVADKFKYYDLNFLTHSLVCGATNTGKSVFLKQVVAYLADNFPNRSRLILGDFKEGIEFKKFSKRKNCTFYRTPEPLLAEVSDLYEQRLRGLIEPKNCVNAIEYNSIYGYTLDTFLPYTLVVVDEFSAIALSDDKRLMKECMKLVSRTRAAGIYWMIGTQRPSVDVISGSVKANISTRIGFSLSSTTDAETVFDIKEFENVVSIGCVGRAWAKVGDSLFEFQSPYFEFPDQVPSVSGQELII
jgi:hypothetical protein